MIVAIATVATVHMVIIILIKKVKNLSYFVSLGTELLLSNINLLNQNYSFVLQLC